jgi:hypothetical protein
MVNGHQKEIRECAYVRVAWTVPSAKKRVMHQNGENAQNGSGSTIRG